MTATVADTSATTIMATVMVTATAAVTDGSGVAAAPLLAMLLRPHDAIKQTTG